MQCYYGRWVRGGASDSRYVLRRLTLVMGDNTSDANYVEGKGKVWK